MNFRDHLMLLLGHFLEILFYIFEYSWIVCVCISNKALFLNSPYFYFHLWREYFLLEDFTVSIVSFFLYYCSSRPWWSLQSSASPFSFLTGKDIGSFWGLHVLSECSSILLVYFVLILSLLWDTFYICSHNHVSSLVLISYC